MSSSSSGPQPDGRPPLTVLVVTYGTRWRLLAQVLAALDEPDFVAEVLVVDNGTTYDLNAAILQVGSTVPTRTLRADTNVGSAGGFGLGLEFVARHSSSGYILMLDDDNVPAPGAVRAIAKACVENRDRDAPNCWMMRRVSRPEIETLITSGRPIRHVENSYAGFSVRRKLADAFSRIRLNGNATPTADADEMDYAPFGGLAIPAVAVLQVGLPRRDYHLYADDHEFTTRLTNSGYTIRLHPTAQLVDVEPSWSSTSRTLIASIDPRVQDQRAYYSARNRRHLEMLWLNRSRLEMMFNALAYWLVVCVDCVVLLMRGEPPGRVSTRVRTIWQAVSDGKAGRLGERAPDALIKARSGSEGRARP